ncbi:unnamed protein product [Phyllotreta striolata]|uniref:Galactosyltransferase N-terminal domain-containing protein n=1 Tax=Phyllotreta striolata TaxID=444603 RepID=A0A9N9TIZ7_PHYSR|nr:unnamed protein product [Phyllotreta striolata]
MWKNVVVASTLLIIFVAVYFPSRHARQYNYIPVKEMVDELDLKRAQSNNALHSEKHCTFNELMGKVEDIDTSSINDRKVFKKPQLGGEFIPENCLPLSKVALIVPYRNRSYHLNIFINYMHWFLQQQQLHYRIFVVLQNDSLPFNRAKMLNYGAKQAIN